MFLHIRLFTFNIFVCISFSFSLSLSLYIYIYIYIYISQLAWEPAHLQPANILQNIYNMGPVSDSLFKIEIPPALKTNQPSESYVAVSQSQIPNIINIWNIYIYIYNVI